MIEFNFSSNFYIKKKKKTYKHKSRTKKEIENFQSRNRVEDEHGDE